MRATAAKAGYRPGNVATIRFQSSNPAALGVAIVDKSVYERAEADGIPRHWFDNNWSNGENQPQIAGMCAGDLAGLDPAHISDDLQMLAAVLLPAPAFTKEDQNLMADMKSAFDESIKRSLRPVQDALDRHYANTLEFPRNSEELRNILGTQYTATLDPWMQRWHSKLAIDGSDYVLQIISSGPDKRFGTADDFVALEVRRNWFLPIKALIAQQLKPLLDYPATADEFKALIRKAGIDFDALRDPWQSQLRIAIGYERQHRIIRVLSAGPDRKWNTPDDFTAVEFSGYHFRADERRIVQAISAPPGFPNADAELRARLEQSGIDLNTLLDPWGRPYYVEFSTEESWGDDIEIYSHAEYKHPVEERRLAKPVKRRIRVLRIKSSGEDGLRGTYDDFSVAEFRRSAEESGASPSPDQLKQLPPDHVAGTGMILVRVADPSGAAVPNAHLVLNALYEGAANHVGEYEFAAVPPGVYELRVEAPGFQRYELVDLPVLANRMTEANVVLRVGSTSQTVEVEAISTPLATESRTLTATKQEPISTPRVREYFPETLVWAPEIDTDKDGSASAQVKLADSVTTWRIAVLASTVDGKIAEADTDMKAFQPLLADLDVPQVLTVGDSVTLPIPIRNYTGRPERVSVSAVVPESLRLAQGGPERLTIAASSSAKALVSLHAVSNVEHALVQVNAVAQDASDRIRKTLDIHPDGERREAVVNGVAGANRPLPLEIPAAAIPGSIRAEVTVFPSLLSRILASVRALLTRPYGCAEQTISSAYPNLLFLRAVRERKLDESDLTAQARKNLRDGYQRLLQYQNAEGGFSYWGRQDRPDVALTAYAVQFLQDAKDLIPVDAERLDKARQWLSAQTQGDASVRALRLHSLLASGSVPDLDAELGTLARKAANTDDPYAVAQFALAAMSAGKADLARPAVRELEKSAKDEQGTAYWDVQANTPFHGWGRSGQIETTALVLSALSKWREINGTNSELNALIDRAVLFVFRNAGPDGAWPTTQSTVQALEALLSAWKAFEKPALAAMVLSVNNGPGMPVRLVPTGSVQEPVTIDISRFVHAGNVNRVSLSGGNASAVQVQTRASWYEAWSQPEHAKTLEFAVNCGPATLAVGQLSNCDVAVGRRAFRGYGMLIADIGLPPGAEVDRGGLTALVEAGTIDSFEIAPDHVVVYAWPQAPGTHFKFGFRPRFAMRAKAAQSMLYDYYNPDEKVVLRPEEFEVK